MRRKPIGVDTAIYVKRLRKYKDRISGDIHMFFRLFVSSVSLLILYAAPPAISDPTDVTTEAGGDFVIADGDLVVLDGRNTVRVRIDSDTGSYFAHDEEGRRSVHIDQPGANLVLGGSGGGREDDDGDLVIFSNRASEHNVNDAAIHLDGGAGAVRVGGGGGARHHPRPRAADGRA